MEEEKRGEGGQAGWLAKLLAERSGEPCPRPMLAGALGKGDLARVSWPMLASYKIDGYRCLIWKGKAYARSGKLHPRRDIQAWASKIPWNLDGELVIQGQDFNSAGGKLRQAESKAPWTYMVFDLVQDGLGAQERYQFLRQIEKELPPECRLLPQFWIEGEELALKLEADALKQGFEGLVFRNPWARYKHGRGTLRDQIMLKLKRFRTAEARVLSVEPQMHNNNQATESPLGYTERSTAKEGLEETDILGKLNVVGLNEGFEGLEFSIGNFDGLDTEAKRRLLARPPLGQVCTFKYFPQGVKEKPRHPVWISWRPEWDLPKEEEGQPDDR